MKSVTSRVWERSQDTVRKPRRDGQTYRVGSEVWGGGVIELPIKIIHVIIKHDSETLGHHSRSVEVIYRARKVNQYIQPIFNTPVQASVSQVKGCRKPDSFITQLSF